MEVLLAVIGALASLLAGGVASREALQKLIRLMLGKKITAKTYSERLSELTSSLTTASSQVDSVLRELSLVAREKEDTVKRLEAGLGQLEERERDLKQKIEALQNVPLPVAEHFAKLVEPGERKSARRDYTLFGAGVVVTTIITLMLQLFSK